MRFIKPVPRYVVRAYAIVLGMAAVLGVGPRTIVAAQAESQEMSASGTLVSFQDGTLTIEAKSGQLTYRQVGANYQTFQNNETGPGSKLVDTADALSRALPGTVIQVDVADREILFGLDYRVIGTFESYQAGQLSLRAAEAPAGFVQKPAGQIALTIDPAIPVLESIEGGDYRYAGRAGEVLPSVKLGTRVAARSEYDPDHIEFLQVGQARREVERYIGQTRGTVRGSFLSFKNGVLRIRGKGVTSLAANEYERVLGARIADNMPIVESVDGGAYQPATTEALKTAKEGTVITIRKVEEVILEIQIGVAKK